MTDFQCDLRHANESDAVFLDGTHHTEIYGDAQSPEAFVIDDDATEHATIRSITVCSNPLVLVASTTCMDTQSWQSQSHKRH